MLTNIVAHDTDYRNFDFSDLTSDERQEFNDYLDETNEDTRESLPEDFEPDFDSMSAVEYLLWSEAQKPGSILKDLWNATVADAHNVMKYSDDANMRRTAQAVIEADGSDWQAFKREASLGHYGGWR